MKFVCPLCQAQIERDARVVHEHAEGHIVDLIKKDHPEWQDAEGLCPRCRDYFRAQLQGGPMGQDMKHAAKRHLIIYTHPNPKSFNHAILETIEAELEGNGHEVRIRDLYDLGFHSVLTVGDFQYFLKKRMPVDIKAEQVNITWAEVVTFIFPIWWFAMPSVLKGYIDRVFARNFAYDVTPQGPIGLLPGKKVAIINTTGGDEESYRAGGFKDALTRTIDAGIFGFCGCEVIAHSFLYAVPTSTSDQRRGMLEEVKKLALTISR